MSDTSPQSIHGPGGLLATPGLGARRRKGRKWGMRTKATRIVGNLYRANDGKFSAGNASAAKPKRGNVLSKQPKPTARKPVKPTRAAAPKKGGGGKGPKSKDPAVLARQQQRDAERAADRQTRAEDRAQRQADRTARLERQAARDAERAKKQQDASGKRASAQIDRELKKRAAAEKKPKAGGSSSKKPAADKRGERAKKALDTAASVGLSAADVGSLRDAAEGLPGAGNAALAKLGLIGPDGLTTDQGRRALSALERGDVRGYQAALQDAKARQGREQGASDRRQQASASRAKRDADRAASRARRLERLKRRAVPGQRLTRSELDQLTDAGLLDIGGGKLKSFAVFKDHQGQSRWIARTTTAYRDRDGEIISEAALDSDSQRMMATKQFGPLRYWHIGQPDPLSDTAPWGPGVDIGDCDYSVVIGRTRIESGTFKSAALARQMAAVADKHEMSPGFFHPLDQPDSDQTFNAIRTFERSPVPTRYGRASNLFTGFTVKEFRMEVSEMERRFKAMYQELGLTPEQAVELGQSLVATEKAASAQGVAFKSETPALEDITINGVVYTVKAAPPSVEAMIEEQADDPMEEIAEEAIEPEAEMAYDAIGDMTREEFSAFLTELLAPVLKMQDMVKSMQDMGSELKTMYGGVASKDDTRAAELAALKSQYTELAQKIAQIEGDQPATILPDDVAEALKSAGPATPPEPAKKQVESTPERPWAGWGAQSFPELYDIGPPS